MRSTRFTRKFVSFLIRLTMLAAYTIAGTFLFKAIEETSDPVTQKDKDEFLQTIKKNLTSTYNMTEEAYLKLKEDFEFALSSTDKPWTVHNSLTFVTTVITTIGYGDMTPKTMTGQLVCVFYALFGIPITALYLKTVSEIIRAAISRLWRICVKQADDSPLIKHLTVTTVFVLTCIILLLGAMGLWEATDWTFVESLYCWFITYSTIGFGDYIPGNDLTEPSPDGMSREVTQTLWKIGYMYLGLALLASIITAISDTMDTKCKCTSSTPEEDEVDDTPYGIYHLKPMDAIRGNGITSDVY